MLQEYDATIKDQIQRGIVEPVEESSGEFCNKTHYLPHYAIIRRDKETTKIRVVYDASAQSDEPSLNDFLHAGSKCDHRILDNSLRFCVHRVAVTADIEKAFLVVAIAKKRIAMFCAFCGLMTHFQTSRTSFSCDSPEWCSECRPAYFF